MVCAAGRRDFSFSSLVARPLGPGCGSSPVEVCSRGCPGAHESAPARRGSRGGSGQGRESARCGGDGEQRRRLQPLGSGELWWGRMRGGACGHMHKRDDLGGDRVLRVAGDRGREPFLVPMEAGAGAWGERLQWRPRPLRVTQQWCFAAMAIRVSSTSIPVADCLTPVPSGCLLAAYSSPLPGFAFQTPHSSFQVLSAPADTHLRLGYGPSV